MQQTTKQSASLSTKAFYFGSGSIAILILEVAALAYGISDGSLMFVAPLLVSPILGLVGAVLGIISLKRKHQPRWAAIVGIILGSLCVGLFVGLIAFVVALATALQGIY